MTETTRDVELADNDDQFVVHDVKAYSCGFCGRIVYDVEALIKARITNTLLKNGLFANDSVALLLLFSPGVKEDHEAIRGITLFQKEEFYLREAIDDKSSVVSFPLFRPMQGGPWDPNLDQRIERLRNGKFLKSHKEVLGKDASVEIFELTKDGLQLGDELWNVYPELVGEETKNVKRRLNNLTAKEVVDLVHREYPDMWDKSRSEKWETE